MKAFIEYIIKNLVDDPDAVEVDCQEEAENCYMEIRVAKDDVGKVVGRQGKTIKALRMIAMQIGARLGQRVRLKLLEDEAPAETTG